MSENKITLDLVTPYGTVFSGEVDEITASGSEGEFGVLPGHANYITTLKAGTLTARAGSTVQRFFINVGFAEVGPNKVSILADSAEKATEIVVERALEAQKRAEERLKKQENIDVTRAEAALERAIIRVQLAGHGK